MTDVDQLSSSLQRIRLQSSSKLDNQQQVSATLLAIEETLKEQGSTLSPTAYFAALSTLLEQQGGNNSGIIYAVLYLLAVVLPGVPAAVLRAKHTVVLKCLGPIVTEPDTATPTLRAALVCLAVLLRSLDAGAWVEPAIKQALQALLLLAVDPRPKVRKDSLEQVSALLGTSPAASDRPSPPAVLAGRTALQLLKDCARVSEAQMTIRVLALVRHLTPAWTSTTLTPLYRALLALPDVGNTNVGVAVFSTFEHLLARSAAGLDATQSQTVLAHLARIKPAATDAAAVAAWYRCVTQGLIAYTARNPATCLGNLVDMFDSLFEDLQMGERPAVHALVTDALLTLTRECLPHALPHLPGPAGDVPALVQLRDTLVTGTTYRYRDTLDRVFAVQAAAFRALGPHSAPLLDPVLRGVADLRMQTDFTFKTEADTVLRAALSAVGPAHFLEVLPLNLDPVAAARQQGASGDHVGRAWLLPLLKDGLRQAPLAYFVGTLLPLADRLAEVAGDFETKGRDMEAKIYHTLQHQVWALLSAFCRTPAAVPTAFTQEFAERLSDVLYGEPELRPIVCNALQTLVRRLRRGAELGEDDDDDVDEEGKAHDVASDAGVASDNDDSDNEESGRRAGRRGTKSATTHADESPVSPDVARAGIAHLSGFAANYLSVLFNVYSTLPMGGRGFVLDAITTLLEITPVADVQSTFTKVQELMAPELAGLTTPGVENPALTDMALTMLDLTQVMAPYVDLAAFPTFPDQIITLVTLQSHPAAQKKGYKLLYNLLQRARASGPVTPAGVLSEATQARLLTILVRNSNETAAGAKKDRMRCLVRAVTLLRDNQLHWIPTILSESILSVKEANERARQNGYQLTLAMARRMQRGGTVNTALVHADSFHDGDEDITPDSGAGEIQRASLEEFFNMVAAGLTSSSSMMISATLSTLASLIFELGTEVAPDTVQSMMELAQAFMTTAQTEVARAAFGLVKSAVLVLPNDALEPHLPEILRAITHWATRQALHLKSTAKHLVERLIRKFGAAAVEAACPADHIKLIHNIEKRKRQTKRGRTGEATASTTEAATEAAESEAPRFANAYEQAVYGSDGDEYDSVSDLEDDGRPVKPTARGRKPHGTDRAPAASLAKKAWIKEQGDQPLDLLGQDVHTRVARSDPSQQRPRVKPSARAQFPLNDEGKFIVNDEDSEVSMKVDPKATAPTTGAAAEPNYYLEAQTSQDGFKRVNNKIKFNKRKAGAADPDDFADDAPGDDTNGKRVRKLAPTKGKNASGQKGPGREYRAAKAAGDVKKSGKLDPFAYVPLNPKGNGKQGIVGKRGRGSK